MQFSKNCRLGTDSQFISHQTLHRPDPTPTPPRPPPRETSRPVLNPATGKQVCYDYQRREGCRFVSSWRYDHVCIKPHCLRTHPQGQHQSATAEEPNTKPILNCRSSCEWYFDYRTSRSCHDHVVKCWDWSGLKDTTSRIVWGKFTYSCRALLRI